MRGWPRPFRHSVNTRTFDKAELFAKGYSVVIGVVFGPIIAVAASLTGVRGTMLAVAGVLGAVVVGFVVHRGSLGFARGAGAGFLAFLQPSGKSSPYTTEYSQGLALEARDDIVGAIEWFDRELTRRPADARLLAGAADLHARHGGHLRAEGMYLEARRVTTHSQQELYCTQRVIDLRLGPLNDSARALPELRRLVDRFPDTREARGALIALAQLKAEGVVPPRS